MNFSKNWIHKNFPIFGSNQSLVYLDSAASTQKPEDVINSISYYNKNLHSNIHRGAYKLSVEATANYEEVRKKVQRLINSKYSDEIVYTKGATEGINLVAFSYGMQFLNEDDEIVISMTEHHSNILPWQQLAKLKQCRLKYLPISYEGEIIKNKINDVISSRTKIVSVAAVSNALGTKQPIEEIIEAAHDIGAVILIDGAQWVPHDNIDVQKYDIDFLVFSGHKMLGPTGIGVLYGKKELLESMIPYQTGGDMIDYVEEQTSTFAPVPQKFEAGTQNIEGVIGLGSAIDYLEKIGLSNIKDHDIELTEYAIKKLSLIENLTLYGTKNIENHGAVIAFNLKDIHPHDVASVLDLDDIAIRAGHHCSQPLMKFINVSAVCRISFYLYNTKYDIDKLVESLQRIRGKFGYED